MNEWGIRCVIEGVPLRFFSAGEHKHNLVPAVRVKGSCKQSWFEWIEIKNNAPIYIPREKIEQMERDWEILQPIRKQILVVFKLLGVDIGDV